MSRKLVSLFSAATLVFAITLQATALEFELFDPPAAEQEPGDDLQIEMFAPAAEKSIEFKMFDGCPCPDGPCDCDAEECDCPDCPEHGDDKKPKPEPDKKPDKPAGNLMAFTSVDCVYCPPAKEAAKAAGVRVVDVDQEPDLARKYAITNLPALIRLDGKRKTDHFEGSIGFASKIEEWQGKTKQESAAEVTTPKHVEKLTDQPWGVSGVSVRDHLNEPDHRKILEREGVTLNGLTDNELLQVHSNLHETKRSGIVGVERRATRRIQQPARRPAVFIQAPRVMWRTQQSGCVNCQFR